MNEIFPNRIHQVRSLVDGRPVGVFHTHDATYAMDERGARWVRKRVENTDWEELLSECLAALFAEAAKAPVPSPGVYLVAGEESFLSALIPDVVSHWFPARMAEVQNLRELGSVVALDVLLFNEDRHAGNILLATGSSGGLRCWGIDFGAALVGWPQDFASRVEEVPRGDRLARGVPLDLLWEPALSTANGLARTPTPLVRSFVREACGYADSDESELLADALERRLLKLPELVACFLRQNGA